MNMDERAHSFERYRSRLSARRTLLRRFVDAVMSQDKEALMSLLAADATWTSDGGGKAQAARKVIRGRELVTRFALGVLGRHADRIGFRSIVVNDEPGLALFSRGQLISVISMATDGAHILAVYSVLNPQEALRRTTRARKGALMTPRIDILKASHSKAIQPMLALRSWTPRDWSTACCIW
jgi:hypothetical protein